VRLNTAVVVRSREANTVLAINAALVDKEDGKGGPRTEVCDCASDGSTGTAPDISDMGGGFGGFMGI